VLALLRDGPEWRPPQDAARCRRLALELGYFGLDSAALDAALAPPALAPHGHTILTLFGARHRYRGDGDRSFIIDTASGGATVVDLGLAAAIGLPCIDSECVAALPDGRVLIWNVQSVTHPGCQRTQVLHLGEGLDAAGKPRRISEAAPAYGSSMTRRALQRNEFPTPGTGATIGGRAMCFGGVSDPDGEDLRLATTQWFDEGVGRWLEGPRMPVPDMRPAVAEHGGCALAFLSDALWRYDPRAPAWASVTPLTAPVSHYASVAVVGDRLLVIGGNSADVRCFDLRAGRWEEAGAAGAPPRHLRAYASAVAVGSEVWCVGGRTEGPDSAGIEIYSAHTNTWRSGGRLPGGWAFQWSSVGVNKLVAIPKMRC